jgi:regulator of nucleoside diphosphate kinase
MIMRKKSVVITDSDARVLRNLLAKRATTRHDSEHLHELALELDRAIVLGDDELPHKVVTLSKQIEVLDLQTGERHEITLVSPAEANVTARRISVLAPLGTALLGYREGDEVEWLMPGGLRRLRIEHVSSEPGVVFSARPASGGMSARAH